MPKYEISVPGQGKFQIDSPTDLSDSQAYAAIQQHLKTPSEALSKPIVTPPEKGNFITDTLGGLATGAGKLMATPTEFTGLLSGEKPYKAEDTPEALLKSAGIPSSAEDVYKGVLNTLTPKSALGLEGIQNKISGLGSGILNPFKATQPLSAELQAAGENIKSTKEKRLEAERAAAIDKEEGLLNEAKTGVGFTLSNPSMLPGFIAEQIPNLLLPAGAGKLGMGVAKSLITNATEKALTRVGVSSAVAAAAAQQGGDTGADTYEAVHKYLIGQGVPEKEAHDIAVEKSKVAAGKAAAISVATGFIPGANALERKLIGAAETGVAKKGLSKYATTGLNVAGEATQEGIEEGGGKYVSNVGLQQVAPETDVMKGVGSSAGLGMLGGAIFGGLTHGAGRTPSTQTPIAKNEWVLDENGNLVKNPETQIEPKGTVTLGPIENAAQQDLFGAGELPNQVDQGVLNEKQKQESEIERNIFALQQQEQTPEVKQQIAALETQLPKGPGQTLDTLQEEHSALSRAHTALDTQKATLEQQREAIKSLDTPSLDKKLTITEQIKAIEAQQTQIDTRRAELQEQAKKLAKQITPEETTAQRKLKEVSPIVGNVMSKFGLTPKAPIRNAIKNLDMTVPEDRQTFIDEINKHSIKGAKINMEEVEKYLSYFEEKPSGDLNRVDTGAVKPSVPVSGEGTTPTEGFTAPVATGMENNIGTPVGPRAGTPPLPTVQPDTLALFKPEGIAENLGDRSRSIVIMMPIQQFLDLSSEGGVDKGATERADKRVAEGTQFTTVPQLLIEHDENGNATVTSHEGRHRARALLKAGYTEMPVDIRSPWYRWAIQGDIEDRDYIEEWPTTLKAQDNASNPEYTVPFPVSREQAANYNYNGVTPTPQTTPTELQQAQELFGNEAGKDTTLLRSGFTARDIGKSLGIIKDNLPTSEKINEWEKAYETAGGQKAMPNVGRVEKTINQVKSLKKSYDDNQDVAGSFFKAITNITSTANIFSFDRAYSNRIRSAFIDLKNKGDITLEQFKLATLRISISQALYRKDLAKKFLSMGNLVYDKITNRWEAINDDINWGNFETLIKNFATDIGGTPEQALKYMSKAYEANRVLDDYKQMDKLSKDIKDTKTVVDTLSKNRSRTGVEEKALNKKRELLKELTKQYQHQVDLVQHMTRAQAKAGVNDMLNKHPAIKQGLDILNTMKQRAVKIMVDTGVKNEDIAKDWINDLTYVPFNRQIDDAKEGSAILSRNLKEVMQERRKEGSMLEVNNTIENMFEWYQWAISRAISNQQMNVMLDQYKSVLPDEVRKGKGPKENTFSVWKNGMEQFYHVADPAIAQTFLGMETMVFPGIGAFMTFKNSFSHLITRNPLFPLKQLLEDTFDALTTSGLKNPFGLLKEIGKEIVKTTKGTSEARAKLSAAGVLMTHDTSALTTADDLTKKLNLDDPSAYRKTMNALDKWAAVNDNIVRQAVYAQGIKEGLSHAMAMEKAIELVNFRRVSGNPAVVFASKIIPFFGAAMQVTDVALKTITGKGITPQERKEGLKVLLSTTAKMAALSFLYAAAASGDDDYKKKTRISRDQSFVIPFTNGFSIPVRPGFFSINKLIGEYGYKYLMEHSTDAPEEFAKAMAHGVMKQFTPPSTTLVTPTLGLYLNRDMYNNRDIVNPTMRKLLPEDQYNKYTSEMAKALAAGTGISALKIDYFLRAYFSSVASLTALTTNAFIADMRGIPLPTMSTRDTIASFPSMSTFMSKEETSDAVADFYDTTKDIATLVDTINNVGPYNPEKAKKLMEKPENAKLLKGADAMERAKEMLQNLNSHERYILEQPESKMNADEKAKEIKKINAEREKVRNVTKNIKESIK